jgi:hypothetical protein
MISLGFIYGFFRVHLELHVEFLIRISLGFLWVSPRVSLGFHLGYKQNKAKEHEKQRDSKDRKQRSKGAGRRAAKTHD